MKKIIVVLGCLALIFAFSAPGMAKNDKPDCVTIQDGILTTSGGEVITTGYMESGYNYQAHIFNGPYDGDGSGPMDSLVMKWNDAWLSNKDCDDDGLLDRHLGFDTYIGSGSWCTNHWIGSYLSEETGEECKWSEFIKIIAVPADATLTDGTWYGADGVVIGPVIWGQFAIIQDLITDACGELGWEEFRSPSGPGLGKF